MQLSLAQEVSLLAMRHIFITQLGLITQRRQQLAQQLHNGPQTVGISQEEMLDAHLARKACLQHLQDCQTLERKLSVQYFIAVCHGVRNQFSLLQWHVPLAFRTRKSCIIDHDTIFICCAGRNKEMSTVTLNIADEHNSETYYGRA